ncbi:MAG: hypothetical protein IKR95_05305 [Oscillospiraceae bacterium]|nr:hypothetical protein [Oscillospiraceae bacterium]
MSVLDGFTSFNFNEGVPYMSVTKNGLTFNKGVVLKLQCPEHVRFLINSETKQVALQCCEEGTQNAVEFFSGKKKESKILSIRWNGKDLLNTIKDLTGWNLSKDSYRVDGRLLPEEHAMLFNLSDAVLLGDAND